jgi:hypothetical protein
MKQVERTMRKDGLAMFGKKFSCPELSCRSGDTFEIRFWPHDETEIYVYENGSCIAAATDINTWTSEQRTDFFQKRNRRVVEAKRRVREAKRAAAIRFPSTGPPMSARPSKGPSQGPPKRVSRSIETLAFGVIDGTFPVED